MPKVKKTITIAADGSASVAKRRRIRTSPVAVTSADGFVPAPSAPRKPRAPTAYNLHVKEFMRGKKFEKPQECREAFQAAVKAWRERPKASAASEADSPVESVPKSPEPGPSEAHELSSE